MPLRWQKPSGWIGNLALSQKREGLGQQERLEQSVGLNKFDTWLCRFGDCLNKARVSSAVENRKWSSHVAETTNHWFIPQPLSNFISLNWHPWSKSHFFLGLQRAFLKGLRAAFIPWRTVPFSFLSKKTRECCLGNTKSKPEALKMYTPCSKQSTLGWDHSPCGWDDKPPCWHVVNNRRRKKMHLIRTPEGL